jgi:hypothetical protein
MRYVLAGPVDGGSAWWEIADTNLDLTVATFFKDLPNVEKEARDLCARLNSASE